MSPSETVGAFLYNFGPAQTGPFMRGGDALKDEIETSAEISVGLYYCLAELMVVREQSQVKVLWQTIRKVLKVIQ